MKQIFEDVGNGQVSVTSTPRPTCKPGCVLIQSSKSLISAGTERMLVDFGRASYLQKARQQPEKVRMVLDKVKADGLMPTVGAVRAKLNEPVALGYSNVGRVVEVGAGVTEFAVGDRVMSNGNHAEVVCIGKNLCAKIPEDVSDEHAVFGVVGSIALQGIRLAAPTIGECFVVVGLGLVGLMTVQLLRANGCRVLGTDFDPAKLEAAKKYGAEVINPGDSEELYRKAGELSRGRGVDGVIITASTDSNDPMHQAAEMCRQRGRIILVGVVGLDLQRGDFYEKELTFQVSCSYGPGRYDSTYEQGGHDYPIGFVRWTEQRNFEAILDMLAAGALAVDKLITSRHDVDDAKAAYDLLVEDRSALGILIEYPDSGDVALEQTLKLVESAPTADAAGATLAAIGAGNYAGRVLLPAFGKTGAILKTIVSSSGKTASIAGRQLGFQTASSDISVAFDDDEINTVVIATQHDTHAKFTVDALNAGKHVFVEKPLALTHDELNAVEAAHSEATARGQILHVMIGFNRRFAPLMQSLKAATASVSEPMTIVYTCNAGFIPADSWVHDASKGGGRIVGEACHFIDAARFLAGSTIEGTAVSCMLSPGAQVDCRDTVSISLQFANGSMAVINYLANGHKSFPKERIEVFQAGRIHVLDNFRKLASYGGGPSKSAWSQDKGQTKCCAEFVSAIESGGAAPIPFDEIMEVSRVSIDAAAQATSAQAKS